MALEEHKKVIIASILQGDDKPMKYPPMFTEANALVTNRIDLLPHFEFDLANFSKTVKVLNPTVKIFKVSHNTGRA